MTSLPRTAADALLRSMRLLSCFSSVVTYGSTRRHKPHADPVVAGVVELGLRPPDCVHIGDQPADIEAGKAAGVGTVAVLWGFGNESDLRAEEPDVVLSHPMVEHCRELLPPSSMEAIVIEPRQPLCPACKVGHLHVIDWGRGPTTAAAAAPYRQAPALDSS